MGKEKNKDPEEIKEENALLKNEFSYDTILNIEDGSSLIEDPDKEKIEETKSRRSSVICYKRKQNNIYRRAFSETQLLDVLGFNFREGESYHCISAGDVDALSYAKCVLRQQKLKHFLFSTWCMAMDDVLQIQEWIETGKIKVCDAYMGEIFKGSYTAEYEMLKPIIKKSGGRFVIFRNHSKIMAGTGDKFSFVIESSANINTNPRAENTCLTIGTGIYRFYKKYFDGIVSFEKSERK